MTESVNLKPKPVSRVVSGIAASDGAGVKLRRIIASPQLDSVDPFLLLDQFESDDPDDYIAGFPSHPHRGFETVTYMLAGRMRHKDSAGNEGVVEPGGVQWMTAGRGIVHAEMPEQSEGLMRGFQLWIDLPAEQKMMAPNYQEFGPEQIPVERRGAGGVVRVIAGITDQGTQGPVINALTQPVYLDVCLADGEVFTQSIAATHNSVLYVIEGALDVAGTELISGQLGILGVGSQCQLVAKAEQTRLLLLAGKRLNQPVVRSGPFVMNTRAELEQAFRDFHAGQF